MPSQKIVKCVTQLCQVCSINFIMGNCQTVNQQQVQVPRQGAVRYLNMISYIWSRKYLGLFDYEAHEVMKRRYQAQDGQKLILIDERMDKLAKGLPEHMKNALFRLVRSDNYYQLIPIVYEDKTGLIQKPIWLVVRSLPGKGYSIKEKDIFKLGKQKMRVREVVPIDYNPSVVIPNESISLSKAVYDDLHFQQKLSEVEQKEEHKEEGKDIPAESAKTIGIESVSAKNDHENICRICLEPGLTTNPLITPCHCSGTVRYIHLLCLKTWLSKQIKAVISDFSVTINWKPLCCQMCKTHYKYRIYLDNQKFYTVDIPKPEKPYIVLEIMRKKGKDEGKIFKFITFKQKNKINIGRKKDVDVKISDDISVSRVHATLKYRQQTREFILEDNKSKFGTLVLAKNGLNLRPHHSGISVQVGAQMFEFQPVRDAATMRAHNYEMGDEYMREEVSEQSEEEEQSNGSQEEDEVLELPLDDNDRSPNIAPHSLDVRRSQSLNLEHSQLQ